VDADAQPGYFTVIDDTPTPPVASTFAKPTADKLRHPSPRGDCKLSRPKSPLERGLSSVALVASGAATGG
jgi:hypothetical protein